MQSPPLEWTLGIGYLAILDYLRSRGEADGDTASECLRDLIARSSYGRTLFAVGLTGTSLWFYRHILSGLDDRMTALRVTPATRQRPGV